MPSYPTFLSPLGRLNPGFAHKAWILPLSYTPSPCNTFICACVCLVVCACTDSCVSEGVHAPVGRLEVNLWCYASDNIHPFLWGRVSYWPGILQVGEAPCPKSPRDPPVSNFPAVISSLHHTLSYFFKDWFWGI